MYTLPPSGKEKSSSWFSHPVENYTFEQVLKYAFNLAKPANKPSLSSSSASSSPLEPGLPAVPWHDIYIHNLPLSPTNPAQVRQQVRFATRLASQLFPGTTSVINVDVVPGNSWEPTLPVA